MKTRHHNRLLYRLRLISVLLVLACLAPLLTAAAAPATSESTPPVTKEEVIYGKLSSKGEVESLYAVNSFSPEKAGEITDFGNYSEVLNLTNNNPITYEGEKVSVQSEAGRFYYQGNLKEKELPWIISLDYKLDGRSVGAEELSGQSGQLEMGIKTDANPAVDSVYFDHYILQISMTVKAAKARNIRAEGATIANAGGDKIINWMVFPGQPADYRVTADISDFSMPGLQISGVPLNLDFELPDLAEYTDEFSQLHDGIAELNSGAQKLQEGIDALTEGANSSADGARELTGGSEQLTAGLSELQSGLTQYSAGIRQYADGIGELAGGSNRLLSGYRELAGGLKTISSKNRELTGGSAQIRNALQRLSEELAGTQPPPGSPDQATQLAQLAQGSQEFHDGLSQTAEGLATLTGHFRTTAEGFRALSNGLNDAVGHLDGVHGGLSTLNTNLEGLVNSIDVPAPLTAEQVIQMVGGLENPTSADAQKLIGLIVNSSQQTSGQLAALKDGLTQIKDGYNELTTNFAPLKDGLSTLAAGLTEACNGLDQLVTNLEIVSGGATRLAESYAAIDSGIDTLINAVGDMPRLIDGIQQLAEQYKAFDAGLNEYTKGVKSISDGATTVGNGLAGVNSGLKRLSDNAAQLKSGASRLGDGATDAAGGSRTLTGGVRQLSDGLGRYSDGIRTYGEGIKQLADGTQQLDDETKDMDKKLEERISEEIEKMTGRNFEPKSFTSARNTRINTVQFVLMTPEIPEPAKADFEPPVAEERSFWEKLTDLFK